MLDVDFSPFISVHGCHSLFCQRRSRSNSAFLKVNVEAVLRSQNELPSQIDLVKTASAPYPKRTKNVDQGNSQFHLSEPLPDAVTWASGKRQECVRMATSRFFEQKPLRFECIRVVERLRVPMQPVESKRDRRPFGDFVFA